MRRFGIEPASAAAQAQRDQSTGTTEPFQPLPAPTGSAPYRLSAEVVKPGLSSTQRVIDIIGDHGGVIEFDSLPRRTIFRVLLPMEPAAFADGQGDQEQ